MRCPVRARCWVTVLAVLALAAGGCEWLAGIRHLHPADGGPVDVDDAGGDAFASDAPRDADQPDGTAGRDDAASDAASDAAGDAAADDAPAGDAAPTDAGPEAGADCGPGVCPNGCCNNSNQCVAPAYPRCGKNGVHCVWCSEDRADQCDNSGNCACGGSPPCTGNYYCAGGVCDLCGAATCAGGCCDTVVCLRPQAFPKCGVSGGACTLCDTRSNDCRADGTCGCNGGPPCAVGQTCSLTSGCG